MLNLVDTCKHCVYIGFIYGLMSLLYLDVLRDTHWLYRRIVFDRTQPVFNSTNKQIAGKITRNSLRSDMISTQQLSTADRITRFISSFMGSGPRNCFHDKHINNS